MTTMTDSDARDTVKRCDATSTFLRQAGRDELIAYLEAMLKTCAMHALNIGDTDLAMTCVEGFAAVRELKDKPGPRH